MEIVETAIYTELITSLLSDEEYCKIEDLTPKQIEALRKAFLGD